MSARCQLSEGLRLKTPSQVIRRHVPGLNFNDIIFAQTLFELYNSRKNGENEAY